MHALILESSFGAPSLAASARWDMLIRACEARGHRVTVIGTPARRHLAKSFARNGWNTLRMLLEARRHQGVQIALSMGNASATRMLCWICEELFGWPFVSEGELFGAVCDNLFDRVSAEAFGRVSQRTGTARTGIALSPRPCADAWAHDEPRSASDRRIDGLPDCRVIDYRKSLKADGAFVCGCGDLPPDSDEGQAVRRAAERAASQGVLNLVFWIACTGQRMADWQRCLQKRPLPGIHLLGVPPRTLLPSLVRSCDAWLVALTSGQLGGESAGCEAATAIENGIPLLAMPNVAPSSRWIDCDVAFPVASTNGEALLDAIQEFIQFPMACRGGAELHREISRRIEAIEDCVDLLERRALPSPREPIAIPAIAVGPKQRRDAA